MPASYADCIHHLLSEARRAKDAAWQMAPKWTAVEPDSFTIAAVKDALEAIFSRPVINHLTPPRGATDRAADGQMSHDKSSARRWHQSLAKPSFRLLATSRETQSDNSFAPIFLCFLCCLIIPDCHYFSSSLFRSRRRRRVQWKEQKRGKDAEINRRLQRCIQIFAQTPLSRWEMW